MSGLPNTTQAVSKPVVFETDGVLGQLPTGGIINAGGVSGNSFTVGGKQVVTTANSSTSVVTGFKYVQASDSSAWTIIHGGDTMNASVTIYNASNIQVFPDEVELVDANTVLVTFATAISGTALVFLF